MNIKKMILLGGVGLVSAAAGILLPSVVMVGQPAKSSTASHAADDHEAKPAGHDAGDAHAKKEAPAPKADAHAAAGAHGGGAHGGAHGADPKAPPKVGPVYLHFDHLVVNLNEPNLVKTLMLEISIKTDAKFEAEVKETLDHERPVLKTWLTSHVADKSVEDIRGKVGINRLRREIQDNFNSLMFKDGHERIQDILFEEWHVE